MARKKELSLKKHAFFEDNSFVNLRATAHGSDDFYINVSASDGERVIGLQISEWRAKENIKMFVALRDHLNLALAFYEQALTLPKGEPFTLETLVAAKKKPAAKKTTK